MKIVLILFLFSAYSFAQEKAGFIIGTNVNIREKPTVESKVVGQVSSPDDVIIYNFVRNREKECRRWYEIKTLANEKGFVCGRYVTETSNNLSTNIIELKYETKIQNNEIIISDRSNKKIVLKDKISMAEEEYETKEIRKFIDYPYIFISITEKNTPWNDIYANFVNIKNNEIYDIRKFYNKPNVISFSKNKSYVAIDNGTAASVRNVAIFSFKDKDILFDSAYHTDMRPTWISDNELQFLDLNDFKKSAPGKPTITRIELSYAQKIIWKDGKIIKTNEFIEVYCE